MSLEAINYLKGGSNIIQKADFVEKIKTPASRNALVGFGAISRGRVKIYRPPSETTLKRRRLPQFRVREIEISRDVSDFFAITSIDHMSSNFDQTYSGITYYSHAPMSAEFTMHLNPTNARNMLCQNRSNLRKI